MIRVEVWEQGLDCDGFSSAVAEMKDVQYVALASPDFVTVAIGRGFKRAAAFALRQVADRLLADNAPEFPEGTNASDFG